MNNSIKYIAILTFVGIIASCGKTKEVAKEGQSKVNETNLLYDFVAKSGNIINSDEAPFMVTADMKMDILMVPGLLLHNH